MLESRSRRSRSRRTATVVLALGGLLALSGCGTRLAHNEIAAAGGGAVGAADSVAAGSITGTTGPAAGAGGAVGSAAASPGAAVGATGAVGGTATGGGSSSSVPGSAGTGTAAKAGSTGPSASGGASSAGAGASKPGAKGAAAQTAAGGPAAGGSSSSFAALMGPNAPIFGGTAACRPATLSPVNIGNVSTLSGVLGQLFSPVVPALQTFVKAQNACGGLNGHPIKLFVEDDQDDPSTAVSRANDEIQNDHILAFLGDIQVLTIDAMIDTINKTKIPMIGGDLTNNTWFTNPLLFPQGAPPQAISYGYLVAATQYFHSKSYGDIYCVEVPQACSQIDQAFQELAKSQFGAASKVDQKVSITAPSYTNQCLEAKNAGIEVFTMTIDAASQKRIADSCDQVGFHPHYAAYPLGVGNEGQFLGNSKLGNTYVPLNTFAWMANATPAERYFQASVKRYNPGFTTGDAAGLGWTSGALIVAASTQLDANNPTSAQFVTALRGFQGNTLGGLTAPLSYRADKGPKIPYCLFAAISNQDNSGWATPTSKPSCTNVRAPSDPNQ